jgi:hypothetical protein
VALLANTIIFVHPFATRIIAPGNTTSSLQNHRSFAREAHIVSSGTRQAVVAALPTFSWTIKGAVLLQIKAIAARFAIHAHGIISQNVIRLGGACGRFVLPNGALFADRADRVDFRRASCLKELVVQTRRARALLREHIAALNDDLSRLKLGRHNRLRESQGQGPPINRKIKLI